jgi:hypothetical protein
MKEIMDWVSLAGNSLWVAGCALALAVISGVSGTARPGGFREHLGKPLAQMGLSLAFFLISAGQAEVAVPVWEKMIWVLLGLVSLFLPGIVCQKGSGCTNGKCTHRMTK